jgi:hypothetical protein
VQKGKYQHYSIKTNKKSLVPSKDTKPKKAAVIFETENESNEHPIHEFDFVNA